MRRPVLIAYLLLCALALASADPAPPPRPDGGLPPSLGFSHFDVERASDCDAARLERLADLGRAFVKTVPVRWGRLVPKAPRGGPPAYRFDDVDRAVLLWQLAGFEPVLVLSPRSSWACVPIDETAWARRVKAELGRGDAEALLRSGVGVAPPREFSWRAWQQLVQDVVERYDGDGDQDMPGLRRPVRYVQVLDRAELPSRWMGTPAEYQRLLHHAGVGAKSADPKCQVVLASLDLRVTGFDPVPDDTAWAHRVRVLLPSSPRAARLEMEWAMDFVKQVLAMPRLFDVAAQVGSENLKDDVVNLRHLRHWLDAKSGQDVRIWLVDNPLPKLEVSSVPRALRPSVEEERARRRWVSVARLERHRDYPKAKAWLDRGTCYDLVRSYCGAHAAGAETVLFFPRRDQLPDSALGSDPGPTLPPAFLGADGETRGPLWRCWDQLVGHVGAHTDVSVAKVGAEGRSIVFEVPVARKHAWVAVLLLDSRISWAGEPGEPMPTRTVAVPFPNGRYRVEEAVGGPGDPPAREVEVKEDMLILPLGPAPVYVIPLDE